jgi:membrane fusion protein (multidrug efflux system)
MHGVAQLRGELEQRKLDVEDRTIRSTVDGVVDRVFVESGEYVTPGQRLAIIHDPADIWIEANIKETQVRRLTIGQAVNVSVDAYPDDTFNGELDAIGDTTTASFALLPNPNPSGNFTKVTQRLPIRVKIEQRERKLRPGMMVEIRIDVRAAASGE